MSSVGETVNTVQRTMRWLAPRTDVMLGVSGLCLLSAVWFQGQLSGLLLLVAGFGTGFLGLSVAGLAWSRNRTLRHLRMMLAEIVEPDPTPNIASDRDGNLVHANAASMQRYGIAAGDSILSVLSNLMASPGSLIRRMQARADEDGAATEDVALRRGVLKIYTQKLPGDCYLWRFDEQHGRLGAKVNSAADINLPMCVLGKDGSLVFVNEAMTHLVGSEPLTLEDLVVDLPVRSGGLHQLRTPDGPEKRALYEAVGPSGRRELYVLPAVVAGALSNDWQFFDALPVPMLKIARSGDVQMANRIARELLGHRAPLGVHLSDLVEGLGRPISDWLNDATRGHGLIRTEVIRAIHPVEDVYLQITLGRIEDEGETALVAVLNDATELKTLEAQFVQSQKMQAIGQLAGGVAHDFNNLLTAISGHCDLLLLKCDKTDPDYADLIQIHQNANRAASLVGQLLAFSRKQKMQLEYLDLRDTMSELTHLLNRLVGEKVRLELDHDAELGLVRADKRQLEQVIMNLVVNARDAMPNGGMISIQTRCERLTSPMRRDRVEVPAGDYILVKVSDEGVGISQENLTKIFEPFWSTKRTEGTGLGLSTAYGIMKQTGGFIFADSVVGEGTSFTLYLQAHDHPLSLPPTDATIATDVQPSHGDGVVLLVEDEAPVRAFAARALKMRGYTVLEADSAETALALLEDETLAIDVFVTDVIMPGMDGPTWVREAQKQRPDTKVVFVSGYAEDAIAESQARVPNAVFLPKPFSLNELSATVQTQLDGEITLQ